MIGWILLLVGLIMVGIISWVYRDTIAMYYRQLLTYIKKNKKKVVAVATTATVLGAGGSTFLIPEGYRPATETLIKNSNGNYWTATQANFESAMADLGADGGTIWLPDCNITVTSDIDLVSNINIIGTGRNCTFYLDDSTNVDVFQIESKENILIEKITIHGNTEGQDTHTDSLIDIEKGSSSNITIRDCYLFESGKSSIDCQEGNKNILVEGCHIDGKHNSGYGSGIWFSCNDSIARNNFIQDTYGCGIVCEAENAYDRACGIIIDGNEITGEIGHGINLDYSTGSHVSKANNCTIVNNHIHDINSTAYLVSESHYSVGILMCDNTTCSNNIIRNVQKYGIRAAGDGLVITDNIIHNVSDDRGIYIEADSGFATTAIVSNNVISNTGTYGIYTSGVAMIDGNLLENTGSAAVYAKPTSEARYGMKITNNNVYNSGSTGLYLDGFNIQYEDAIISHNYVNEVSGVGIWVEDTSYSVIDGNRVVDGSNSNEGIRLNDAINCTIYGNIIEGFATGIDEQGNADYNIIELNNCLQNTLAVDKNGANSINLNNLGNFSTFPTSNMTVIANGFAYVGNGELVIKTGDGSWLTLDGTGGTNEYPYDQDLNTTDAVTFTTVNTGQGANELYDMDQNVLTSSDVEFENVTVDDKMVMSNGGTTWNIYVNATGVLVWEIV